MRNTPPDTTRGYWDPDGDPLEPMARMTSTEARNRFGRVLDVVARNEIVVITKHGATKAVVMSPEIFQALTGVDPDQPEADRPDLDLLAKEFDELVRRMQTPEAREGMRAFSRMSPEELGRAAVEAAQARHT